MSDTEQREVRKVLVVDDSRTIQMTARRFLEGENLQIVTAKDGYEAVKAMFDHQPDIVLVDVMMPRIDGYKFCAVVKKHSRFAATPVIMLTSKDGLLDKARARLMRADGYLVKPFTRHLIAEIIGRHLSATPARPAHPPLCPLSVTSDRSPS